VTVQLTGASLCTLKGQVRNPDGTPAANANVSLRLWCGHICQETDNVQADDQGQYTIVGVFGNATYLLTAKIGIPEVASAELISVGTGQTLQLPTLVVYSATTFAGGTVTDGLENPIAGITVTDADVPSIQSTTDQNGRFLLNGIGNHQTYVKLSTPSEVNRRENLAEGQGDNTIRILAQP